MSRLFLPILSFTTLLSCKIEHSEKTLDNFSSEHVVVEEGLAASPSQNNLRLVEKIQLNARNMAVSDFYQYDDNDTSKLVAIVKGWEERDGKVSMGWSCVVQDSTGAVLMNERLGSKVVNRLRGDSAETTAVILPMSALPKRANYIIHLTLEDRISGANRKMVYTIRRR